MYSNIYVSVLQDNREIVMEDPDKSSSGQEIIANMDRRALFWLPNWEKVDYKGFFLMLIMPVA